MPNTPKHPLASYGEFPIAIYRGCLDCITAIQSGQVEILSSISKENYNIESFGCRKNAPVARVSTDF
jgi:hypothetical protein